MAAIVSLVTRLLEITLLILFLGCAYCKGMGCECGTDVYGGTTGSVTSPNHPRNYPNKCRCTYNITVESPYGIMVHFDVLDFVGSCDQDFVVVLEGTPPMLNYIGKLCSTVTQPMTVTTQSQSIIILFVSANHRGMARGFRATYSIVIPTTPEITIKSTPLTSTLHADTTSPLTLSSLAPFTSDADLMNRDTHSAKSPFVFQTPALRYDIITDLPTISVQNDSVTDMFSADIFSFIENYVWMLSAISGGVLFLMVGIIIVICFVRNRRLKKTVAAKDGRNVHLNSLDANDPTVIVNHTYQSSDDFIPSHAQQFKHTIRENSPIYYSTTDQKTAVYTFPETETEKSSSVYQTADGNGVIESPDIKRNQKYHKYTKGSEGEHIYQTTGMDQIDKSGYQAAGRNSPDSASFQSPENTAIAYDYPIAITQSGVSSTPAKYMRDPKPVVNVMSPNTDAKLLLDERSSTKNEKSPRGESNINEYELLGENIEPVEGGAYLALDASPSNDMNAGDYLEPDVFVGERKDYKNHEYDLVHTGDYQIIEQSDSKIPSNDTYDVVNVMAPNTGQRSMEISPENETPTYESFEDLTSQGVGASESPYTEYKTEGNLKGVYQDLKPHTKPMFVVR